MLKIATMDDFETVRQMASSFVEVSGYEHLADEQSLDDIVTQVLSANPEEMICIIYEDKGMIAGAITKFPFGKKYMATEIAWWVDPESRNTGIGKELLGAFEFWAKEKTKATSVTMVSLDESIGDFYVREGYKLYERAYVKEV